ncbi:MAG TPA: hypothetical protein DCR93_25845 [Cytophagales bacterium]|nr:hypothetical protein [Cytophagales bacterium]HAP62773.1 hypothetical protein [Cytophagales bacterium]
MIMRLAIRLFTFSIIFSGVVACSQGEKEGEGAEEEDTPNLSELYADFEEEVITEGPELEAYLEGVKLEWSSASNPMTVTFAGMEFGDYAYLIFEDEKGNRFNLANGDNDYGDFDEYDFIQENSPHIGKKFTLEWDWKKSQFNCCQGQRDLYEAKVPSITDLELAE